MRTSIKQLALSFLFVIAGSLTSSTIRAQCASASSLTTFYAQNNGQDGIMFDISATNSVTIRCFDSNFDGGSFDCEIYYKAGTHVGSEGNAGAWTLAGSATGIASNGVDVATPIPINVNVTIPAGQTYAFYITTTGSGAGMNYTNGTAVGNVLASDASISILEGTGKDYAFGSNYTPRQFNGTVYYDPGCSSTISSFPYSEDFESGIGSWTQVPGDDFDWSNNSAGTPSTSTGPSAASSGTYYMYTEASGSNYPSKTTIMESPCFDLSSCSSSDFTFDYHMYGAGMGTLYLEAESPLGSGTWTTIWSMTGDQGNSWNSATVSLNAYAGSTVKLRFRGVTGSSYTSDMAVDNINVSCTNCTSTISSYPYNESFESGIGSWGQSSADDIDWTNNTGGTTSSSTGPSAASDGSYYMYTEASGSNYPSKIAIMDGPCFDLSSCSSSDFTFDYHMYGAGMGDLYLEVESPVGSGAWTTLWSMSGDQGNAWNSATVSLNAYIGSTIKLRFRGVTGSSFTSDMAVDNISVTCTSACISTISSYPYSEDFESGIGTWSQNPTEDFDWSNNSGGTTSGSTGPSAASSGTYYMYTESSSPNYSNKTAIMDGPCFDLSSCSSSDFTFDYHMYGSAMGTLYLEAESPVGSGTWTSLWSLSGDQGNAWNTATVSLNAYAGSTVKLRFRGVTGTSFTSDMAVDNINVTCTSGGCSPTGLTTFYANNNGQDGIMFDITASNTVTVQCFDSNFDLGTFDCEVYYKAGTHVGSETNAGAWTLAGSTTGIASSGVDVATSLSGAAINVTIPAGQTYAFYITNTGGSQPGMNYTNGTAVGNVLATDANISILEGTGKAYPFGSSYTPRQFNGTVYYIAGPLPVELTKFNATCQDYNSKLTWETASEINNDYFAVQRSMDGENFKAIGVIKGNGSSNSKNSYTFIDDDSPADQCYYRLKQVDYDGEFSYSDIITANCSRNIQDNIEIYPNPTRDILNIAFSDKEIEQCNIKLYDLTGRIVADPRTIEISGQTTQFDISDVKNGVYFIEVTDFITGQVIKTGKVVKN